MSSSPFTRQDLIEKILEHLGVLAAGQTAQAEDVDRIDKQLDAIVATLASTEVVYIGDIDQIPDDMFSPLSAVVAWDFRNSFGAIGEDLQKLSDAKDAGYRAFKVIQRGKPTYAALRTEYF